MCVFHIMYNKLFTNIKTLILFEGLIPLVEIRCLLCFLVFSEIVRFGARMSSATRPRVCRRVTQEEALLICKVYSFFKKEKEKGARLGLANVLKRPSDASGLSRATVARCLQGASSMPLAGEP